MWKPYLNVIAKHAPNALNILDRYHIAAKMNKALDVVRAKETRALKLRAQGAKVILTHSRWCLLKRPENVSEPQAIKLKDRCSRTTCKPYAPTCSRKSSSCSGNMSPRRGRKNLWTNGAKR